MDRTKRQRTLLDRFGLFRLLSAFCLALAAMSTTAFASEPCGTGNYPFPYTDVASVTDPFCPGIMEAYVTGISKGTTPTTFSPNNDVIRVQMTTFLQRTVDQTLARANRRAALNKWWTPQTTNAMQTISLGGTAQFCAVDGDTIWVTNNTAVIQVQASTGAVLGTWTPVPPAPSLLSGSIIVAAGKVFVGGDTSSPNSSLYVIDPTQPPGPVTVASTNVGVFPLSLAFDGTNLWTANQVGSVSIITLPGYTVTTVSTGFNNLAGILYDGAYIWVTDEVAGTLMKLSPTGAILQTVNVGIFPQYPAFDGANIWVPNYDGPSITVVQASTGNVVATITGDATNSLTAPYAASFDGERILVTNFNGNTVSVFKAADLSFITTVNVGPNPQGACNDGINFWIPLSTSGNLLRF